MIGRIGATISGVELRLLNQLREANAAAAMNAFRLASGKKINYPSDNPAGFVNLRELESERVTVASVLNNVAEASGMVSQAQLTLDLIRTQLNTIREKALADEDQTLTADERAANQSAIDEAIEQIESLVSTTIQGRRLLDGSAAFDVSGANIAQVRQVFPFSPGSNDATTISGTVTSAATQATVTHVEALGLITANATFSLEGARGDANISVANGETLDTVAARVNQESHRTGVTASVVGGTDLVFSSIRYGSREQVSIDVTSGSFTSGSNAGTDATATINGRNLTGVGNQFAVTDNGFSATVEFQGGFSGAFDAITVSGEALSYALSPELLRRSTLSIPSLHPGELGGLSGTLDQLQSGGAHAGLGANAPRAVRVVDEALGMLTQIEGLVDGFANAAIDSSSALLAGRRDRLDATISDLNQIDEDAEELLQSKNEALAENAVAGLAILNQQRESILDLIRQVAGLI
jgi:flagellin-like hook-associated protein FlgL